VSFGPTRPRTGLINHIEHSICFAVIHLSFSIWDPISNLDPFCSSEFQARAKGSPYTPGSARACSVKVASRNMVR
jgi:hypothetical protein